MIYDVFVIRGIVMAGGFGSRILFGIAMGHDDGSIRIVVGKVRGLLLHVISFLVALKSENLIVGKGISGCSY